MDATPEDMSRRIAAAKDYGMLQGLITAGVGLACLLGAATRDAFWLSIGCAFSGAIGTWWYQNRYGRARGTTRGLLWALVIVVVAIGLITTAAICDIFHRGPVLWTPLVAGPVLALGEWFGLRHVGMTAWHWLACIGLTLCALIPLFGHEPGVWFALGTLSLPLIVIGVVDHRRLVGILGTGVAR